jgi:catechol 2,3-dioxygenase-like lactoylglutathione lyase family enzyme
MSWHCCGTWEHNSRCAGRTLRISFRYAADHIALVVRDYDEAITFFTKSLGFNLIEDTPSKDREGRDKRWVLIAPPGSRGAQILLAKASNEEESLRIGNQTGGRVCLFLHTDNFWRDYNAMKTKGVKFIREPKQEEYGTVAVFEDLYGNKWDLLEQKPLSS